jgi:hypothetical protein
MFAHAKNPFETRDIANVIFQRLHHYHYHALKEFGLVAASGLGITIQKPVNGRSGFLFPAG